MLIKADIDYILSDVWELVYRCKELMGADRIQQFIITDFDMVKEDK